MCSTISWSPSRRFSVRLLRAFLLHPAFILFFVYYLGVLITIELFFDNRIIEALGPHQQVARECQRRLCRERLEHSVGQGDGRGRQRDEQPGAT